jgi:hypothetical protein
MSNHSLSQFILSYTRVQGALSLRVKRPGSEADHSPPSCAEVKECVELYFHSPNTTSLHGAHLKHRDNFTFTRILELVKVQMVHLSATRCSCIAILWVSLVSFAAITLCITSQRGFIVVVYFVIDSVRKLLDTPSYVPNVLWVFVPHWLSCSFNSNTGVQFQSPTHFRHHISYLSPLHSAKSSFYPKAFRIKVII